MTANLTTQNSLPPPIGSWPSTISNPKILIIDDHKENSIVLNQVLDEMEAEVIEVTNSHDALAAVLDHNIALVIQDIAVPSDGFDVADLLRSDTRTRDLPIIFLTADNTQVSHIIREYGAGTLDYIVKPYDPLALLAKVKVFLEQHRVCAKLTEKVLELSASEACFRTLVMTVSDIVYRIGPEGRFTYLNDAVRQLGYAPEELIGAHFSKIMLPGAAAAVSRETVLPALAGVHTEPLNTPRLFDERRTGARITTGLEVQLMLRSGGKPLPGQNVSPCGDSITVEVSDSGLYVTHPGNGQSMFLGSVGVMCDRSERKRIELIQYEHEALFRTMFDNAGEGILFIDPDGWRLLDTNPAAERMLGCCREEIIGLDIQAIIPPCMWDSVAASLSMNLAKLCNGSLTQPEETAFQLPNGSRLPVEAEFQLVPFQGRHVLMGSYRDLNERRQVEETERKLLEEQTAARVRNEMIAMVSHELRTPLTALLGFTELLQNRDFPPAQQHRFLSIIDQEGRRLNRLVDDFLDLERMESGRQTYRFETLDMRMLAQETLNLFRSGNQLCEIENEIPIDLPMVWGDADRLRQVMQNLVSNALKFSPQGGRIGVGARVQDSHVVVWVKDQGYGIPDAALPHLFQRFYRVEDPMHQRFRGTGLGLALVREIVMAHGGWAWVESELGCGSTFYFTLRLATVAMGEASEDRNP